MGSDFGSPRWSKGRHEASMSPRPHLYGQAAVLTAALIVCAVFGYAIPAVGIAASVILVAFIYLWRYHAFRVLPLPDHRRECDRLVGRLIAAGAGLPGVLAVVLSSTGPPALIDSPARVWFVTAAVVISVIFISSLIDWYWVLPRLGGLGEWPRPCQVEVPKDDHPWRFLTQYWYGHRLVAEFVAVAAIPATAVYVSQAATSYSAVWGVIAVVSTSGLGIGFFLWWRTAWSNVNNPELIVGSVIRVARIRWRPQERELYVVDVDLRGVQCMFVDDRRRALNGALDPASAFSTKKETTSIKVDEDVDPQPSYWPPCGDHCTGINWYCANNPRAYDPN
jgi:hypothetical protein